MKYKRANTAEFRMMGMPMPRAAMPVRPMVPGMGAHPMTMSRPGTPSVPMHHPEHPMMKQADDGLRQLAESGHLAHKDPAVRNAAKTQYDKWTEMKRSMGQYGKQY